ncbi:hypothetical protein GOBAR_DD09108 [Gossypium barbadense]|nr:hypothetical protein GOBAR_DD09108 [Gossypium barbadense]
MRVDKMPRRKVRSHCIVQGTLNSAKTNSTEQQTAIGSSNVPVTPEEPIEDQNETGDSESSRTYSTERFIRPRSSRACPSIQ